MKPELIKNFREISDAFCEGLATASSQLGELTNFDETFSFTPTSIHFLAADPKQNSYETQAADCCLLEVLDSDAPTGYAGLIFKEGDARKLVGAILKSVEDGDELDREKPDVIAEVTNIMINSCLAHLAEPLDMKLAGGLPSFDSELVAQMQEFIHSATARVLILQASFENEKKHINGDVTIAIVLRPESGRNTKLAV